MEQLTGIDKEGAYLLKCQQEPCKNLKGNCSCCGHMQQALERLAEYECLEIMPEQVRDMDKLYRKKCEDIHKLKQTIWKAL